MLELWNGVNASLERTSKMDYRELANREAEKIENDDTLTDREKAEYLHELGEQLYEAEH